jgi:hypothetical protein
VVPRARPNLLSGGRINHEDEECASSFRALA